MRVAVILACIAAGWALVANEWLITAGGADAARVGLFGVQLCPDLCPLETWQKLHAADELLLLGGFTGVGLIKLIVFAMHALVVKDKTRVKVRWTLATAAITIALGVGFVLRAPARLPGMPLTLGYAPFVALAATLAMAALVTRTR